jgi:outer membrane protein assembly factor BamD
VVAGSLIELLLVKVDMMRANLGLKRERHAGKELRGALLLSRGCALLCAALLTACWSSSEPEPEPEAKEIKAKDSPLSTEAPEAELLALSKQLYQARMYTVARDSLQSLKERYPLGAYATFADIKVADSYFFNGEYNEAAKFYEGFLKSYPGSPDSPYVELQAARSHVRSSRGVGRDRQPLERALTIYDGIVQRYPGSSYAQTAERERAPIIKQLADYDQLIINFYHNLDNKAAVEARERQYNERWASRLSEAKVEEAQPETPLRALPPLTPPPLQKEALRIPPKTSPQTALDSSTSKEAGSPDSVQVQQVECHPSNNPPYGAIEMSRLPKTISSAGFIEVREPVDGVIAVTGLGLRSSKERYSCFGTDDVEITRDGTLLIRGDSSVELSTLESPPRLLVTKMAPQ